MRAPQFAQTRRLTDMRSDTNQLDLIRDEPRVSDPVMDQTYREEAVRALAMGDTATSPRRSGMTTSWLRHKSMREGLDTAHHWREDGGAIRIGVRVAHHGEAPRLIRGGARDQRSKSVMGYLDSALARSRHRLMPLGAFAFPGRRQGARSRRVARCPSARKA